MQRRKTSLDILRIFATCQVISHHCFEYPLGIQTCYKLPLISELIFSLMASCNIHFMLISSYLASTSKYYFSKQFPVILTTIFYSVFSYFLSIAFFKCNNYDYNSFLIYLFPIANSQYWYIGPFLLSSLLCSTIYPTLQKQNKNFHFLFMIIITFLYCMQFVSYYNQLGLNSYKYSSFLVVSLIGSFIRYYEPKVSVKFALFIFILMYAYQYYIYCHKTESIHWYVKIFWVRGLLHPSSILFGISSFILALKINIQTKYDKYFKILAELSLPIYIIHFHTLNKHLWIELLKQHKCQLNMYWKYNLTSVIKIFAVCGILETIYKKTSDLLLYKRKYWFLLTLKFDKKIMY